MQADGKRAVTMREHRWLVLGCCLTLGITSLDVTIVNVALPTLSRSLHTNLTGLQWVIDGYMLVLASLLVLTGSVGDRLGRRRMLRTGLVLFGIASAACSLAPSVTWLVIFRVLQGTAAALLVPNALSTLTNVITEPAERARAIGIWSAVFGIAAAAGPLVGGLLVEGPGWRSIFWVNLPVVAVTFALITRFAPETKAPHPRRLDLPGQLLILVTIASATAGFIEAPAQGWASAPIIGLFALALLALAGFIATERRAVEPLIDLRFFSNPSFSGAAAIATLAFAVFSGFLLLNTLYLQEVRGASPLGAGLELLPAMAMIALGSPLVGREVALRGSRIPLTFGGATVASGTLVLALAQPHSPYLVLAGAYALVGLGLALVNPPITYTTVSGMPTDQAGVASAIASSTRQLGNVLGVAVLGSLLTSLITSRLLALGHASGLPQATRRQLLAAAHHGALVHGGSASVHALYATAFVDSGHVAWWVATGLGCAVALIGYATGRPRETAPSHGPSPPELSAAHRS
jgi:EmrB/QacA subfamily drug resistance transporter